MKHRFQVGDAVTLREDRCELGLSKETLGVVWALYATTPPSYDVTFVMADGEEFDAVFSEPEIEMAASQPSFPAKAA